MQGINALLDPARRQKYNANHSKLMYLKSHTDEGQQVNLCPFGCHPDELDECGYCRHLVGFSKGKEMFEPMEEVTQGHFVYKRVNGKTPKPILKTDHLERITCNYYRVYRDVDTPDGKTPRKAKPVSLVQAVSTEPAEPPPQLNEGE